MDSWCGTTGSEVTRGIKAIRVRMEEEMMTMLIVWSCLGSGRWWKGE